MKHATPNMADTLASNGELSIRKPSVNKPDLKDIGSAIWIPMSKRNVGYAHYTNLKREGIDLSQLERNCWIDGFDGTLSDDEFLAQHNIAKKPMPKFTPASEEEYVESTSTDYTSTIVTQAKQIDELTKDINLANTENARLLHELERLRETSIQVSRKVDSIIRTIDTIISKDESIPF